MRLKATARLAPQTDRCRIPYRTPNRSGRQEPMVSRIYVEKKPGFDVEAQQLKGELTEILGIKGIEALRIINRYDVEGIDEELFRSCVPTVFSEPQVDVTYDELPASDGAVFAVEFLPGQFDQRADSASECVQLISQGERPAVRSAKVYMISGALDEASIDAIKHYVVNPVEARIASLDLPETLYMETPEPQPVEVLDGFRELDEAGLAAFISERGLAMDEADIAFCQQYFRDEDRDPTITEIRVIDTYWSDHCRHTTFGTVLDDVTIDDAVVQQAFDRYMEMRHELGRDAKPVCLMDMGTIGAKYLKKTGVMTDVDESEEINACTVKVKVDVDGEDQDWLFLFKNETHNHPTEIEPFGGAATCLGGAIRDPLSGRTYVYQAMRVTGAADPTRPQSETLEGKLPQKKLVREAAHGYSSYGNQIGLATGYVKEVYHPDYVAKRMEIGAVLGGPLHPGSAGQRSTQLLALRKRVVFRRFAADDALTGEHRAVGTAGVLPGAHPFAVAPAIGAEQRELLAGQGGLTAREHRLELILLQRLRTHGGAAEGNGVKFRDLRGGELIGGQRADLRTGLFGSLGDGVGHLLGVAGTAPINNCDLTHDP